MDVVYICHGLGNQMSQYAFYLKKKEEGVNVDYLCWGSHHNGIELDKLFGIDVKISIYKYLLLVLYHVMITPRLPFFMKPLKIFLRVLGVNIVMENKNYGYNPQFVKDGGHPLTFYNGGFHHWKYFEGVEQKIRDQYVFPEFKNPKNIQVSGEAEAEQSVAIHIRRGDYLDPNTYKTYGAVCDENYYQQAIVFFEKKISNPIFYIFTNDMEWARNFMQDKNIVCVDWNKKEDSWADMALMSKFKNIIIANSTFSWWAAWLGVSNKNVVCPPYLVNKDESTDIFPPYWHHIKLGN